MILCTLVGVNHPFSPVKSSPSDNQSKMILDLAIQRFIRDSCLSALNRCHLTRWRILESSGISFLACQIGWWGDGQWPMRNGPQYGQEPCKMFNLEVFILHLNMNLPDLGTCKASTPVHRPKGVNSKGLKL